MDFQALKERFYATGTLSAAEGLYVLTDAPLQELLAFSHAVTEEHAPGHFDLCSICNVKSGRCSEDCHWCAQSRRYATEVAEYGVLAPEAVCAQAKAQHAYGVGRFALVASGRRQTGADFMRLLDVYAALGELEGLKLCASLGLCTKEQLQDLKAAGVKRIHCNLETAPSFFPQICSTHGIEEKIRVIKDAQSLGLEVCSGGILGLGESLEQRVEFCLTLRSLNVRSIPLNILHPIAGTPLSKAPRLLKEEFWRVVALFRLTIPDAWLRFAGGRAQYDADFTRVALYAGVNASIVGNLLTTAGREIENDLRLFKEAGYAL